MDDAAEIEATIAKEVEINPSGEFAAALKMLGVAPTAAAIDALRDELIPGGVALAADVVAEREALPASEVLLSHFLELRQTKK